jgi:hypothetical protein
MAATAAALAASTVVHAADFTQTCGPPTDAEVAQGCFCTFSLAPNPTSPVAFLDNVKGDVLKSGQAGFTPVTARAALIVGDSVLLKSDGQALLTAGATCSHLVGPQASLTIKQIGDGCGCAALAEAKPAGGVGATGALAAVALGAGGVAALLALSHHAESVSP